MSVPNSKRCLSCTFLTLAAASMYLNGCGEPATLGSETVDGGSPNRVPGVDAGVLMDVGAAQAPRPEFCQDGFYVADGGCLPCPRGSTRPPGDDPSGPNTSCQPSLCATDHRVADHRCVPCPHGEFRNAGDPATGLDTFCEAAQCEFNQRVSNGRCVACPPGTINDPGDLTNAGRSLCDTIRCQANERVRRHACVRCSPPTWNEGGDDATGEDTSCLEDLCQPSLGVSCPEFNEAYLKASHPDSGDEFGCNLDYDGETLAVAACDESSAATGVDGDATDNSAYQSGAVYLFEHRGGRWQQVAYIKPSHTERSMFFGGTSWTRSVSIHEDTLAVGAWGEDGSGSGVNPPGSVRTSTGSGAVYVYRRVAGLWSQEAYIKAPDAEAYGNFGGAVVVRGDTLVVGAIGAGTEETDGVDSAGKVFVYQRGDLGGWRLQASLSASNPNSGDSFGDSLALSGETLAVGAAVEDSSAFGIDGAQEDNDLPQSGAVYIFTRTQGTWSQQAYLKASNPDREDRFGFSVALDGDALAVGALYEQGSSSGVDGDQTRNDLDASGAVYVFRREGTRWSQEAYLKASNPGVRDFFSWSMSLDGARLSVGAIAEASDARHVGGDEGNDRAISSGAVYLFERTSLGWHQRAYIKPFATDTFDYFGSALVLRGNRLIVGSPGEASAAAGVDGDPFDNTRRRSGAVYVRTPLHPNSPVRDRGAPAT